MLLNFFFIGNHFTVSNNFQVNVVFEVSATYENKQCDETHIIKLDESWEFLNERICGRNVLVKAVAQDNSLLSCQESASIPGPNYSISPFFQNGTFKCILTSYYD